MLTIRLSSDIEQRLTHLAEVTSRSKSFYVREALERSLEDIEDAYLAEAALERFKSSGEKSISLTEAMRDHGLDN